MTAHFQRGFVLYQQGRNGDAIAEFQRHLLESPEDAITHALISHCLTAEDQVAEATEHAQKAIALEPESAIGFQAMASCMLERNREREARSAIEEALRLDPDDADSWALLSQTYLLSRDWRKSLESANRGLAIQPEHTGLTNLRAQALVQLGDKAAAAATMDVALALNPDDAWTHANKGWALLHANEPRKAMEHFREALRLDPTSEWARMGIVEAMQARSIVYRYLLRYFLWAGRLPRGWQWGIMLGGYFGTQALLQMADAAPAMKPFVYPIIGLYVCFAIMTWLGPSFFNLLLRFDRFGRHALSIDQRRSANLLAFGLVPPILLVGLAAAEWNSEPIVDALYWTLLLIPCSAIFRCEVGWPRWTMIAATCVIAVQCVFLTLPLLADTGVLLPKMVWLLIAAGWKASMESFIYVFIGLQLLANYLLQSRVRR